MQGKFRMDLSFCQAENGFSLDELVQNVSEDAIAKSHESSFCVSQKSQIGAFSLDTAEGYPPQTTVLIFFANPAKIFLQHFWQSRLGSVRKKGFF